jgi:regulator of sirC expression with transglutaminase-like and TPR domain
MISVASNYLEHFMKGAHLPEVLQRRADAYYRKGEFDQALRDYSRISENWPTSKEAAAAKRMLEAYRDSHQ